MKDERQSDENEQSAFIGRTDGYARVVCVCAGKGLYVSMRWRRGRHAEVMTLGGRVDGRIHRVREPRNKSTFDLTEHSPKFAEPLRADVDRCWPTPRRDIRHEAAQPSSPILDVRCSTKFPPSHAPLTQAHDAVGRL